MSSMTVQMMLICQGKFLLSSFLVSPQTTLAGLEAHRSVDVSSRHGTDVAQLPMPFLRVLALNWMTCSA